MSWKCADCGTENHDDIQKCPCGHISISETSASPNRPDKSRFGDCSKAILMLLLVSIANTFVTFRYNDFTLDGYWVPYHLGQGIGSILFVFVIFFIPATIFNYFSKKNRTPYSKISLKVTYFTAAFSVLLMFGQISIHNKESAQSASKEVARQPTEKIKSPIMAAITRQGREGLSVANLDQVALKNIEEWLLETMIQKAESHYAQTGNDPKSFKPKVNAKSVYMDVKGKKLGVIKINFEGIARSVNVVGLQGDEFIRVTCFRSSDEDILVFSGECGSKVKEAFGVSLP